jgi:hypothetical protein
VPRTAESTTPLVLNCVWICMYCVDLGSPRNNKEIDTFSRCCGEILMLVYLRAENNLQDHPGAPNADIDLSVVSLKDEIY